MEDIPRNKWYRFFEILPGTVSLAILFLPVIISPFYPRPIAIFMVFYVTFWFLRILKFNFYLLLATHRNRRYEKIDWNVKLAKLPASKNIRHVVILATYKEPIEVLQSSIKALAKADFPLKQIFFVLATEERDANSAKTASDLQTEFGKTFAGFFTFAHPVNIHGEVPGKGSNICHAGKKAASEIKKLGVAPENVLVTTLDADNRVHPLYFSILTHHYLTEKDRKHRSYQPLPLFYNNIWEVPTWNRLIALASSFWQLALAAQIHILRNFSAHAQSLDALLETNFWSRQTIVEDGHQYWRSYFAFKANHEVVPLFIPIYQDAVQNKTYFSTLKGQYTQLRRWAWGCSDIPYVALKMWKERKNIPFWKSFVALCQLIEGHIMWATAPIVITLTNSVPRIFNREFAQSVFAFNENQIFSVYFTIGAVCIVISVWISLFTMPKHPHGKKWRFLSALQWILLPIVTIIFSAIPAIDAQMRLMLNKPLRFQVTEKVRKVS